MAMAFDTKCYNLAVDFLEDCPQPIPEIYFDHLAQRIQDAIEDFLKEKGL